MAAMTMDTDGKIGDRTPAPKVETLLATMRAWVQEGRGTADVLQLREIPLPAIAADRVLVKVRAASVNALDYHTIHGGLLLDIISKLMRSKPDPYRGVASGTRRDGDVRRQSRPRRVAAGA